MPSELKRRGLNAGKISVYTASGGPAFVQLQDHSKSVGVRFVAFSHESILLSRSPVQKVRGVGGLRELWNLHEELTRIRTAGYPVAINSPPTPPPMPHHRYPTLKPSPRFPSAISDRARHTQQRAAFEIPQPGPKRKIPPHTHTHTPLPLVSFME